MAKRYISNDTADIKIVGGVLIPPGEGREVDEQFLPPEHQAEPNSTPWEDPAPGGQQDGHLVNLQDLLASKLSVIVPQLAEFGDETLAALAALEGAAENPRKTLLGAISQLQLERAAARTDGGQGGEAGAGDGTSGGPTE